MGQEIANELDEQNKIIDGYADLVKNKDKKHYTETRDVNMVDRNLTSGEWIMVNSLLLVVVWPSASGNKGTTSWDIYNGTPCWYMKDTLNKFPQNLKKIKMAAS